jgi:hypothetical protein
LPRDNAATRFCCGDCFLIKFGQEELFVRSYESDENQDIKWYKKNCENKTATIGHESSRKKRYRLSGTYIGGMIFPECIEGAP